MQEDDPLGALRREIDDVDAALVALLARRMRIVDRVIAVKKSTGVAAVVPERIEAVVARVRALAERDGVPPDMAEKLWRLLIAETIAYEQQSL